MARSVASTDGVYFVPALTGLGAPDWEPHARGTITGLTRGTTSAHLVRAALEAMAYGTADVLTLMRTQGQGALRPTAGGRRRDEQRLAHAVPGRRPGVPVERPDIVETTALGAAGLAGIAGGVWKDAEAFLAARHFTRFVPGEGSAGGPGRSRGLAPVGAGSALVGPRSGVSVNCGTGLRVDEQ